LQQGVFAPQPGQLLAQLVAHRALLGFVFPLIYLLLFLLNGWSPSAWTRMASGWNGFA